MFEFVTILKSHMDLSKLKKLRFFGVRLSPLLSKSLFLILSVLIIRTLFFPESFHFGVRKLHEFDLLESKSGNPRMKFLEVPQIVWGLNNQKIAFARACLTAKLLNRTLLMPSLSASLFYKEIDLLQPISFDKVFQFDKFNSLCKGFIQLGQYSDLQNHSDIVIVQKGSGRRWTPERDIDQLNTLKNDESETIRITGKNPFLWHDHWPVKYYAKVFECLILVDEISKEADKVVAKIKEFGSKSNIVPHNKFNNQIPYVAVHMRIEKDWMIHCKKLEQRSNVSEICSSKDEITNRVANIPGLKTPSVLYLAVADALLEDGSVLNGWAAGLHPVEKKKLGVTDIYKNHPYLIQSAIDYEVCLRADVFVGNSYSTFSSLVVLERSQKMVKMGGERKCGMDAKWPSYAYNLKGEFGGPKPWMTEFSDSSLQAISYGSNNVSC